MATLSHRQWRTAAQASIEYAFLIVLIGMICLAVVTVAGRQVQQTVSQLTQGLNARPAAAAAAAAAATPSPAPTHGRTPRLTPTPKHPDTDESTP